MGECYLDNLKPVYYCSASLSIVALQGSEEGRQRVLLKCLNHETSFFSLLGPL